MVSLLFFIAGTLGGLVCIAFLIGVLMVDPLAFFILMFIMWGVWKLAGRGSENWFKSYQQHPQEMYTGTSLDDPTEEELL